jgi:hypothetical protein
VSPKARKLVKDRSCHISDISIGILTAVVHLVGELVFGAIQSAFLASPSEAIDDAVGSLLHGAAPFIRHDRIVSPLLRM